MPHGYFKFTDALLNNLKDTISYIQDKTNIDLPLIVKPNDEGSTYGLRKVTKESEFLSAIHNAHGDGNKILVEEFFKFLVEELVHPVQI